ncbi:MAG: hypothetical protein Q610_ECBC00362G0001, partial [Escherichia coli DORA_B_14]
MLTRCLFSSSFSLYSKGFFPIFSLSSFISFSKSNFLSFTFVVTSMLNFLLFALAFICVESVKNSVPPTNFLSIAWFTIFINI